jgi:hypothetical protein
LEESERARFRSTYESGIAYAKSGNASLLPGFHREFLEWDERYVITSRHTAGEPILKVAEAKLDTSGHWKPTFEFTLDPHDQSLTIKGNRPPELTVYIPKTLSFRYDNSVSPGVIMPDLRSQQEVDRDFVETLVNAAYTSMLADAQEIAVA